MLEPLRGAPAVLRAHDAGRRDVPDVLVHAGGVAGLPDDTDRAVRRGLLRRRTPEPLDEAALERVAASRARTGALCRAAVEELTGAAAPHDVTHAGLKQVALGTDVLTVHGSGWDLGRYVLWPDGTLREAGERFGWVDEATGDVRLRSDGSFRLSPDGVAAASCGGVWRTCVVVPHLDVEAVGSAPRSSSRTTASRAGPTTCTPRRGAADGGARPGSGRWLSGRTSPRTCPSGSGDGWLLPAAHAATREAAALTSGSRGTSRRR